MKTTGILVLLLSCALAQAEETLPAPTGTHKIGRVSFHWKDSARDELETSAPDDKRELDGVFVLSGGCEGHGLPAVYVPDADVMRGPWNH